MSEQAGRDVGTTAAARSYFDTVLPAVPRPLSSAVDGDTGEMTALPPQRARPA
jgi:hypothetical protein